MVISGVRWRRYDEGRSDTGRDHMGLLSNRLLSDAKWVLQRLTGRAPVCAHVSAIREVTPRSDGCAQCLALGDTWVHLRLCLTCGEVGCCDSSKNRHAHRHADAVGHPIARSAEHGEDWAWCFVDEAVAGVGVG